MIKGRKRVLAACAFLLVLSGSAGWGNAPDSPQERGRSESGTLGETEELSGSILLVGSTSMETYVRALAEGYMECHPNINVNAEFAGSGAGIEAVLGGTADIGNSSRSLNREEKEKGAVENVVAIDGIAVCVDRGNRVGGLTRQQLKDIYTGAVTNWSEVGGQDAPVVVVGREAGSGTRKAFEKLLDVEDRCAYANELDSEGAVMARVAATPGAIGYVSLQVADEHVNILALDGIVPAAGNLKDGKYILSRPFVMATFGEISEQNALVKSWFDYVLGGEGQRVAVSVGLLPVKDGSGAE